MVTNISWNRSAILGSNVNQLWISDSGETFSILAITCCCIFSITAVCIGETSGNPKNCLASSGVQSISTLTFMTAPLAGSSQYRHDNPDRARTRPGPRPSQFPVWSTKAFDGKGPGIGKRGLAGHHFGQQATGRGSERQAVVLVAEIEP